MIQLACPWREVVCTAADYLWADRLILESLKLRRFTYREPGVTFLRIAKEIVAAAGIEEQKITRLAQADSDDEEAGPGVIN